MSHDPVEISIVNDDGMTIFSRGDAYEIPLYQRRYAWGEKQIAELIEDIQPSNDGQGTYYLGTLVVKKRDGNKFEVIDGQQRLTTLFLLLAALEPEEGYQSDLEAPAFTGRPKAHKTLTKIKNLRYKAEGGRTLAEAVKDAIGELDEEERETSIWRGMTIVAEEIDKLQMKEQAGIFERLKNVKLFRIEVPEHTDLNRYFEIMNTRGEQLEQHEIVKATLMSQLDKEDEEERNAFSTIWEACSDMNCYVQMRFFDTKQRKSYFGSNWEQRPEFEMNGIHPKIKQGHERAANQNDSTNDPSPHDIKGFCLNDKALFDKDLGGINVAETDEDKRIRFESIIDFPYFLLHALKVFVYVNNIESDDEERIVWQLLDDSKLIKAFERVRDHGMINGQSIDPKWFAQEFIKCLLVTRYLFDRFIVKREYAMDSSKSEWSLKMLKKSSSNTAYYVNTSKDDEDRAEDDSELANIHKNAKMLQACLRVSYTSPRVMHWITDLLTRAYTATSTDEAEKSLERWAEMFAVNGDGYEDGAVAAFVKDDQMHSAGVNTPHIVLNYLDYLLWRDQSKKLDPDKTFDFQFRTSVEHWYPRHPDKEELDRWKDVDRFGNLCIMYREINSKFSNLTPVQKAGYDAKIKQGSLKLRDMAKRTNNATNEEWKEKRCEEHEKEMIALLKESIVRVNGEMDSVANAPSASPARG